MSIKQLLTGIAVVASLAVAQGSSQNASAQTADAPMQIVFTSGDDSVTLSEVAGREVAVTAADAFCLAQLIEETDDEVVVTIGTEDQPEACRIPGAGLTVFADGQMVEMVEFVPGAKVSFTDYTALPDIGRPVRPADYHLDPVPAGAGTHLVTWRIGSLSQAIEVIADADALWVTSDGGWLGYVVNAPGFVNAAFLERFPHDVLPARTPLVVVVGDEAASTPWEAADLLSRLDARDIDVDATGDTVRCTAVDGAAGTEYAGDNHFVLWVYPDAEAVTQEWNVQGPSATHHVFDCNRAPARIWVQDNLVVWTSADEGDTVGYTLPELGSNRNVPLVPHINQFALVPPAEGAPFGGQSMMDALGARGLTYVPYEQPGCPYPSAATVQTYGGPLPGEGPEGTGFNLWAFPTEEALQGEWDLGVDGTTGEAGVHVSKFAECDYTGGTIYRNGNMLLMLGGGTWEADPDFRETVVDAFRSLRP